MSETMQQIIQLTKQLTVLEKVQLIEEVIPDIEFSLKHAETNERNEWLALSAQGLERAYGQGEPEYSSALVKEPNPEYIS